jgi:fatty-acyl-CoA synthase
VTTVAELFVARAEDDGVGLRFEDEQWTWRQVVGQSRRRAALLEQLRQPGPFHVGVLLDNVPEYLFVLGGAALAGATVVGINPTRRGEELAGDIRHTDCQVVLTDAVGVELLRGLDVGARVVLVDGDEYGSAVATAPPWPADHALPAPDTLYLLLFTSGSTGAPKAV